MKSLRARLLVTLLAGLMLVWAAAAGFAAWRALHEIDELLDAHLAQSASLLVSQIGHELDDLELEHAPPLHRYAQTVAFQVWEHGRVLRLHSVDAPNTRLSGKDRGYASVRIGEREWRVFSTWEPRGRYLVQVAESAEARAHVAREMLMQLFRPLLLAVPLFGLLVWWAVGTALKPLGRIGREIARRDPTHLAPIEGEAPKEIAPLVAQLNSLFARVQASLTRERRFTSDAAHELRTPLAGLKTQLQVAQGARDAAEREHAITQAIAASDRATHLVEQLLTLARLEHDAWAARRAPVDLHALAASALAEAAPAAGGKDVALALEGEGPARILGHEALLAVLLRNLLDNAIRYTPGGGTVTVHLAASPSSIVLAVRDEGPGIPPAAREAALRTFHRLEGAGPGGSGLGLSIAARIAELHDSRLELGDAPGGRGLEARVVLVPGAQE